jgi:phage-related protein
MSLLPFEPTRASSRSVTPRFLMAPFGDGYSQRSGDGIQTIKEEWSVWIKLMPIP